MRLQPTALTLLLVLVSAHAAAQCARDPTTSVLTVEGFGAAYYQEVRTDSAADEVEFYGGVCVASESGLWTVEAERIVISGLRGGLQLRAEPATVTVVGWHLEAVRLTATRELLAMEGPRLAGPTLSGGAAAATMNLVTGDVELRDVLLQSPSLVARGSQARLRGGTLEFDDPMVTPCTCPGQPFFAVRGVRATVDLGTEALHLRGGRLHVGGVVVPLADPIELTAESLAELTVPLAVAYVPDTATRTGTGLGVVVRPLPLTAGLEGEFGATGLDLQYPLRGVAVLHATSPTATVTVGQGAGGLRFEVATKHALAPWLDAGFDVRLLDRQIRDGLKEGVLHLRAHAPMPAVRGDVSARAFAAASAQEPAAGPVAGARLGLALDAAAATATGPAGRLALRAHAELTGYPDAAPAGGSAPGALQWGVQLAPEWRYTSGPFTFQAGYLARWTNGASPFTTELDRLTPVQRLTLGTRLAGPLAPAWSAALEARGSYDLVPRDGVEAGVNAFTVSASLTRELADWRLAAGVAADLAGVVAPNGERGGRITASVTATHDAPAAGVGVLEFRTRARTLLAPVGVGLDLLELSAAVPIVLPGVELRPFLAVDVAPTLLRSEWPAISGHGITATFETCCGAFTVGYRNQENVWSVSLAVDLARRPPPQAGDAAARCLPAVEAREGTPDAILRADAAATATTCTQAPASGAGIMPDDSGG